MLLLMPKGWTPVVVYKSARKLERLAVMIRVFFVQVFSCIFNYVFPLFS